MTAKGRSKVVESGQTLILGWNERVIDIIRELIIANESEKKASVVILAEVDKEEMDDGVFTLITDTKTTKIVTRNGSTSSLATSFRSGGTGSSTAMRSRTSSGAER